MKAGETAAADFNQIIPAALTVIKLDGDSQAVVPVRQGDNGLEIDDELIEVHERNVATAIEYRASLLEAL